MKVIEGIMFVDWCLLPNIIGIRYDLSDVLLYQINPPSIEGFIEFIFVVFDSSKEVCGVVPELFIIGGACILHADIIDEFDDL